MMPEERILDFISNEDLIRYTRRLIEIAQTAEQHCEADLYRNVIDPFSALIDASWQGISLDQWLIQERARQMQKALQNEIGNFHQNIVGSIQGWENMGLIGGSFDVKNEEQKVIAEIKNKHNTLNSNGLVEVYRILENHLDYTFRNQNYTAYYVTIVPKNPTPLNEPFTPSYNSRPMRSREDLRKIDGKSFYELATGDPNALEKLYKALPTVLAEILGTPAQNLTESEAYMDLFSRAYNQ